MLFGSIAKTANNANSDMDLCVNSSQRDIKGLDALEKKLKRKVELHFRTHNSHLKKNTDKGIRIRFTEKNAQDAISMIQKMTARIKRLLSRPLLPSNKFS